MKILIQRVLSANVKVDQKIIGQIGQGLLLFVGIEKQDDLQTLTKMCHKVLHYRIFGDDDNKMNLNVLEVQGEILAISQFTLAADTQKGLRPSFSQAASPAQAEHLYNTFIEALKQSPVNHVATGRFAADMEVSLTNDGPVTFMLQM